MKTDLELITQALNYLIAKQKRRLKRTEIKLLICENDYSQMLTCKSITNQISKIQQLENLKNRIS
jgi:hypothetical protein